MKNLKTLKSEAKSIFGPYYIYCLIIVMIYSAVMGAPGFFSAGQLVMEKMSVSQSISQTVMLLSSVIVIFVVIPMEVGVKRFFLNLTRGEAEMGDIIAPFKNSLSRTVIILILRNIKIMLWSCLLIVPGIYKAYEYAMVPYILAEQPGIQTKHAFERSKKMMAGNKLNLFKLQISFLGWYILALIPAFAGLVFLAPYTNTAYALFYDEIKKNIK